MPRREFPPVYYPFKVQSITRARLALIRISVRQRQIISNSFHSELYTAGEDTRDIYFQNIHVRSIISHEYRFVNSQRTISSMVQTTKLEEKLLDTKQFEQCSREELEGMLSDFAKNWLAHDGLWFQAVE